MRTKLTLALFVVGLSVGSALAAAFHNPYGKMPTNATPGDHMFANYFRIETHTLSERCLADVQTLEDWTGVRFTFTGGMAQLFHSKQATGTWGKANVYLEPSPVSGVGGRNWYYDDVYSTGLGIDYTTFTGYLRHKWSPTP